MITYNPEGLTEPWKTQKDFKKYLQAVWNVAKLEKAETIEKQKQTKRKKQYFRSIL